MKKERIRRYAEIIHFHVEDMHSVTRDIAIPFNTQVNFMNMTLSRITWYLENLAKEAGVTLGSWDLVYGYPQEIEDCESVEEIMAVLENVANGVAF